MPDVFLMSLADIQPSQLYISKRKLAQIENWWRPADIDSLTPIPVKRLNGRVIYLDGHTRAFAVHRQGFEQVPVYWDPDELDWDAYQVCVDWCLEAGIHTVKDLDSRLLGVADYQRLWLDRCATLHQQLRLQKS